MKHLFTCYLLYWITLQTAWGQDVSYLQSFEVNFNKTTDLALQRKMLLGLHDSVKKVITNGENIKLNKMYDDFCKKLITDISANPTQRKLLPLAHLNMSSLHFYKDGKIRLEYAYKALDEAKRQDDKFVIRKALQTISSYLVSYSLHDQALPYLLQEEQALKAESPNKVPHDYSSTVNTIAMCYQKIKNYEKAAAYFEKCLQSAEIAKDTAWIGLAYGNMATMYWEQKNYTRALAYLRLDVKYSLLTKNIGSAINAWIAIAQIQQTLGEGKKGSQAMDSAWALLATIPQKDVNHLVYAIPLYKSAYKFYKENKEFEKLPMYADSLLSFFERQIESKYNQDLSKIHAQYNVKIKEQEVQSLKKEKSTERRILYLMVVIALFVIAFAVTLFMNNRKQLKINALLNEKQEEIESQNEELNAQKELLAFQNEALQNLNSTKDKLFSIVSHDFRSPLNALKATTYLMSKEDISLEEIKDLTLQAKNQINHTSYFLENLLFWAKSQFKGFQIEAESFDLAEVLQENLTLVLPQAEQKGVNLAYQAQAQALVLADHNMIRLVVRNLLSNAVKYCRQGDTIQLSYQIDNEQVTVSIQDTGIGMNAEQLKTVFTPHVASTYGTNNEKGAGLGLMLCKDFVERNAGKIWVESEAGKGSTFFFTLPIAQTENTDTADGFWVERLENGGTLYRL